MNVSTRIITYTVFFICIHCIPSFDYTDMNVSNHAFQCALLNSFVLSIYARNVTMRSVIYTYGKIIMTARHTLTNNNHRFAARIDTYLTNDDRNQRTKTKTILSNL